MPQIAKTAEDLSRRSNLIALNTSLKGAASPANSAGIALLTEEMSSLSVRAESVNKELSAVNESLLRHISEMETALETLSAEIAGVSLYFQAISRTGSMIDRGTAARREVRPATGVVSGSSTTAPLAWNR